LKINSKLTKQGLLVEAKKPGFSHVHGLVRS
jgi:hypothetical protein